MTETYGCGAGLMAVVVVAFSHAKVDEHRPSVVVKDVVGLDVKVVYAEHVNVVERSCHLTKIVKSFYLAQSLFWFFLEHVGQ